MQWYLHVLKNYATFSGRARRQEYWMYALITTLISIVLTIIDTALIGSTLLAGIYALGTFLPSLAVGVRRLHDTGRSGWWMLIAAVPLVGAIVLLVFFASEGNQGPNAHGNDPKFAPAPAAA